MTRKEFLKSMLTFAGGVWVTKTLAGCTSENTNPAQPDASPVGNCLANGTNVAIGGNHGHSLTVSKADVAAGIQKSYDISGMAGHGHTVTLSAQHFATLAQNNSVSVVSTNNLGHDHTIAVACA